MPFSLPDVLVNSIHGNYNDVFARNLSRILTSLLNGRHIVVSNFHLTARPYPRQNKILLLRLAVTRLSVNIERNKKKWGYIFIFTLILDTTRYFYFLFFPKERRNDVGIIV